MRTLWPCLLLLSACAASAPETPAPTTVADAKPAPAKICYEDVPTGTRFARVKCVTQEQDAQDRKAGEQAADSLRQIRHGPLQDPR